LVEFSKMQNTTVIVGGGFSGTVLAAHLLRRPPELATQVVLIERSSAVGRGVAYAERDFPYRLNVPAERLSAYARDPLQFLRFAQQRMASALGGDFLPRALYGEYLEHSLQQAEHAAPAHIRLRRIVGEVSDVAHTGGLRALTVRIGHEETILADRVILALGNPPPPLLPWADELRDHSAFRPDPWDLPKTFSAHQSVLILGNGLTMADVALSLSQRGAQVPTMHSLSRHGVVPLPQSDFRADAVRGDGAKLLACTHSLRKLFTATRCLVREIEAAGGDWREAVTFVRNLAPRLWRGLPEAEQRRFVRHLQAHWAVHRHRLPPECGARIEELRRSGKLLVKAGRIRRVSAREAQLQVQWQPRGSETQATLTVDLMVNAMGPDYVLERSSDPLVVTLRAAGLISPDALQLGIRTAQFGACVDSAGHASDCLYYLGPMLRAAHWEATGATELRDHAAALAAHLSGREH
jgi:uncharacterized NAD(P)/FAD-binding protein YdhS